MVGSTIKAPEKLNKPAGQVMLNVENICCVSKSQFGTSLTNVTFDLRQGEILGIGGVAGNGIGLLSAPEERLGHAAAPNMSLIENTLITAENSQNLVSRGFIDWKKSKAFAEKVIKKFDVRTPGSQNTAGSLSGGNLQKFVIGREILQNPSVFIVNQPTWGVDAAAASSIRQALLTLSENGAAILVISQDLDELLEISDQFAALNGGALSRIEKTADLSMEQIGLMMGGAKDLEVRNV